MDEVGERMDGYGDFASGILQRLPIYQSTPCVCERDEKIGGGDLCAVGIEIPI